MTRVASPNVKLLFVADGSPVSLSELPAYCKTFVQMLGGSVVLVSNINGCFVQQQVGTSTDSLIVFMFIEYFYHLSFHML